MPISIHSSSPRLLAWTITEVPTVLFPPQDVESLWKVFTFSKKSDLKRYSRKARIYASDFTTFIIMCRKGFLPFLYRCQFSERRPNHLAPTKANHDALVRSFNKGVGPLDGEGQKALRKVFALLDERRCLAGHMFFTPGFHEWHFFYFDQRDMAGNGNHWQGGAHIHLVNWLWPNLDPRMVLHNFEVNNKPPSGALHLRYDSTDDL